MLTAALAVLRGVDLERVEPATLLEVTATDPSLLADGDRFHIEAADRLIQTKTDNDQALKQLQSDFARMTAGLVTEILGFALAAGVHF